MSTPPDGSLDNSMDLFDDNFGEKDESGEKGAEQIWSHLNEQPASSSTSTDNFKLECPFCDEGASDEFNMRKHIESYHVNGESIPQNLAHTPSNSREKGSNGWTELRVSESETFVCPYCSSFCQTKGVLADHLTMIHGEELEHSDLDDVMRSLDLVMCPLCRFTCSSALEMELHVNTQHSSRKGSETNGLGLGQEAKATLQLSQVTMCPVCGLEEPDSDLLTSHIELHFETSSDSVKNHGQSFPSTSKKPESSSSSSSIASSSSSTLSESKGQDKRKRKGHHYKHQYRQGLEKAVMKGKISPGEFHEQIAHMQEKDLSGIDDGHSKVEGLIQQLETFYRQRAREGQSAVFCSPMDYYCGSFGDKGWGCGYRNFQMMLSCLGRIDLYASKLSSDGRLRIPSVPKIQEMIETAWSKGFDREGCLQLEGKLAHTCKWIGATEIVATLSSMGIRCELVDFPRPSSPDGSHPRLLEWVRDYFHNSQNARPPLYLQHQGHSRTIVGVEVEKGTTRLLLFDPGSSKEHVSSLRNSQLTWKQMGSFRRNLTAFKSKQYQIVSVIGLLGKAEYEKSKRLTSTRIM